MISSSTEPSSFHCWQALLHHHSHYLLSFAVPVVHTSDIDSQDIDFGGYPRKVPPVRADNFVNISDLSTLYCEFVS